MESRSWCISLCTAASSHPHDTHSYGVDRGFISEDLGRFATAHEARALAVHQLPSGLDAVAVGAAVP
ncbi:DUF6193 family natural product biosynthesis protein [Streptomyces decoyicus]|uniref:DUF6193 family natural product biosynthesis protein n=1 Tax=Streptomyces decoyicus TaxID=249567 RepID=UPI00362F23AC